MAGTCFTAIRGRRMRITKVNSLGRPIYGPASQVSTSGFVSVNMSPEIAEGTEIEVLDAAGDPCVQERSCDSLRWITVQIEFCKIDVDLLALINDTWTLLKDCDGVSVGIAESYRFNCDTGFALEVWTDVTGYKPLDPNAQGAWLYFLLSFLVGGSLGEETIENGPVTHTLTARTKRGSGWGRGPYNVMCNDPQTRTCGPLLVPVAEDEPRRRMLVTCPPPAVFCGAQPLNNPTVAQPTITEDTSDTTRMTVRVVPPATGGPYRVTWGDGTAEVDLPAGGASHQYPNTNGANRDYIIQVRSTTDANATTWKMVSVPFTGTTPVNPLTISVTEDTTVPERTAVNVTVNNAGQGPVTINWGDSTATATNPGDGTTVTKHTYATTGNFTVTATDADDSTRTANQQVTIPFGPQMPVVTVTQSTADTKKMTVSVTVDNHGLGTVTLDWGDGTATATNPGDGTAVTTHKYGNDGTYTITATDTDNATITATRQAVVPFDGGLALTLTVAESSPAGPDRRTVTASWDNQDQGPVTITFGESGETPQSGPVAGTLDHTYAAAGTYTVTVTDANNSSRSQTAQATVPFTG